MLVRGKRERGRMIVRKRERKVNCHNLEEKCIFSENNKKYCIKSSQVIGTIYDWGNFDKASSTLNAQCSNRRRKCRCVETWKGRRNDTGVLSNAKREKRVGFYNVRASE